jgi:GDP-D-mannose 3',5'-epimerase
MDWAGRKILVTGGAGLIGSTLVENLVERGAIVTVADNLWRGKRENLIVNGHGIIDFDKDFYQVDLIDYYNCSKVVKGQEIVYHLADVVAGINYVFGNQLSCSMPQSPLECKNIFTLELPAVTPLTNRAY